MYHSCGYGREERTRTTKLRQLISTENEAVTLHFAGGHPQEYDRNRDGEVLPLLVRR